jgi:hypothetical protein
MIEGRFGDKGQVYFEIDLISGDGLGFPVETMLIFRCFRSWRVSNLTFLIEKNQEWESFISHPLKSK